MTWIEEGRENAERRQACADILGMLDVLNTYRLGMLGGAAEGVVDAISELEQAAHILREEAGE